MEIEDVAVADGISYAVSWPIKLDVLMSLALDPQQNDGVVISASSEMAANRHDTDKAEAEKAYLCSDENIKNKYGFSE